MAIAVLIHPYLQLGPIEVRQDIQQILRLKINQ